MKYQYSKITQFSIRTNHQNNILEMVEVLFCMIEHRIYLYKTFWTIWCNRGHSHFPYQFSFSSNAWQFHINRKEKQKNDWRKTDLQKNRILLIWWRQSTINDPPNVHSFLLFCDNMWLMISSCCAGLITNPYRCNIITCAVQYLILPFSDIRSILTLWRKSWLMIVKNEHLSNSLIHFAKNLFS